MKYAITLLVFLFSTSLCFAHVSPPVRLATEQEVVSKLLPGLKTEAKDFRLTSAQRSEIQTKTGWKPTETSVRLYLGKDENGNVKSTVLFVTEYTLHGSVRVAASCDPDGKVTAAKIVECSEESYNWVKPLVESDLMNYDSEKSSNKMTKYYGQIVSKLLKNAPAVVEALRAE